MSTIASRISEAMQMRNMKQSDIVRLTGINKASVSSYLSGKYEPKRSNLEKIASALNVSLPWLEGQDISFSVFENAEAYRENAAVINVLGEVAAGIPREAVENIESTIVIPGSMAATGDFFGLVIKGDSMSPRIIPGDIVIVRRQEDAENGDLVIAMVRGEAATCKRLMKYKDGISLISFNPSYKPMSFTNEEIKTLPVTIIGRVMELRAKF